MPTVNQVVVSGIIDSSDLAGTITSNHEINSELGNALDVSGQTSEVETSGAITALASISGALTNSKTLRSALENKMRIIGQSTIPVILDRTAIHYATTANWNADPSLIGECGHLYIYSDYRVVEDGEGNITNYPALKVGDGNSYLVDLPFLITGDDQEWIDHIHNQLIHVSTMDRSSWNSKVTAEVNASTETLVFDF